jgi:hypothetical protein
MAHTEQRARRAAGKLRADIDRRARARTATASATGAGSLTRARLRDWYSNELESKVARAVAEGHVAASQAADLHRLVGELFDDADGRVSR